MFAISYEFSLFPNVTMLKPGLDPFNMLAPGAEYRISSNVDTFELNGAESEALPWSPPIAKRI